MKSIVEELELIPVITERAPSKETAGPSYLERARALGFLAVATILGDKEDKRHPLPYPEITKDAIGKLLSKRLNEMLQEEVGKFHSNYFYEPKDGSAPAKFHCSGPYPNVDWIETPTEKYQGIPPSHVLSAFERAKETGIFEKFAIVTVEKVQDPLLIGITKDDRRGLIDHWDSDIDLDEVIGLTE
jgi:hypothetical protein